MCAGIREEEGGRGGSRTTKVRLVLRFKGELEETERLEG